MVYRCTALFFEFMCPTNLLSRSESLFSYSLFFWWCVYWCEGGTTCHSHDITAKANHNKI